MDLDATRSTRNRMLFRRREAFGDIEGAVLGGKLHGVETSTSGGPVLAGKLDVAVAGPVTKHTEDVAQVLLDVEAMQTSRRDEGHEVTGAATVVVGADKQPSFAPQCDRFEATLGRIVVCVLKRRVRFLGVSPSRRAVAPTGSSWGGAGGNK